MYILLGPRYGYDAIRIHISISFPDPVAGARLHLQTEFPLRGSLPCQRPDFTEIFASYIGDLEEDEAKESADGKEEDLKTMASGFVFKMSRGREPLFV